MSQNTEQEPVVLVVDDDPDILELMEMMLECQGSKVITADNTEKAFDILREREESNLPLDQIWTDLRIPKKGDGANFLHRVIDTFPSAVAKMGVVVMSGTPEDLTKEDREFVASKVRELRSIIKPNVDQIPQFCKQLGKRKLPDQAA